MEDEVVEKIKTLAKKWRRQWPNITGVIDQWERAALNLAQAYDKTTIKGENMGIEGVEDMHPEAAPLEDAEAVEEEKREEEGIEPTEPVEVPSEEPAEPVEGPPGEEFRSEPLMPNREERGDANE